MSELHIRHIQNAIDAPYTGLIDMSDYETRQEEARSAYLSRALGAYTLGFLDDVEPAVAGTGVVDGFGDNGIDVIHIDQEDKVVYLIQSKWSVNGTGGWDQGEVDAFLNGVNDLINARFDRFNQRVQAKQVSLTSALDDPAVKFKLVFCSTRTQPLAGNLQPKIDEYLDRLNDSGELAAFQFFDQAAIHRVVADQGTVHPIELEVFLHEWGKVRDPYLAYYGQVSAGEVASWHETHGTRLFEKNLRKVIDRSDVNSAIGKTLEENPDRLVYFNNGIVALCDGIEKKPLGGDSRDTGCFVCRGVSVVNGAQTVGAIAQAARLGRDLSQARVLVRFIATTNCPPEFAREVTRATNTQNRIERQDFAALDPQQARLKSEMLLDRKQYAYKTGENTPPPSDGCTLVDATIALACAADDVGLAVQAKREVGKLWEDIERPPYRLLFNGSLNSTRLWRCVEVMRSVDEYLESNRSRRVGRDRLILVHGK